MNTEEWYKKKYGVSPSKENQVMIDVGDILELQEEFAEYYHTQKTKELIEWVEERKRVSYELIKTALNKNQETYRELVFITWDTVLTKLKEDLNE